MEYTVQEETMQAIADAIRERSETSDPILTSDMPSLILTLKAKWGEITGDIEDQVDLNELFAKVNGYYEDMAVGSAEQLLSNIFETDKSPYLYRTSGGSLEIGDRVYEDAIVGGSIAWNQLVKNGNFVDTNNWAASSSAITLSASDNILSVSTSSSGDNRAQQELNIIEGHRYLLFMEAKAESVGYVGYWYMKGTDSSNVAFFRATDTEWHKYSAIKTAGSAAVKQVRLQNPNSDTTNQFKNVMCIDLTSMFGSEIADYVYALESGTAGAGIAWLKSYGFFIKDYYSYDAGSIQSAKPTAHKMVGFNQWDEEWEVGQINVATGENRPSINSIRTKNYIPILPDTKYFKKSPNPGMFWNIYYDANKNYVSYAGAGYNSTFITPPNAYYMRSYTESGYGNVYNNDICINFHWDGEKDGEYEAYSEHVYPLDNVDLLGIPKLDTNNKLYYYGNTYESDGTGNDYFDIVDLGTLNWTYNSTAQRFTASFSSKASTWERANAVCGKYVIGTWGVVQADTTKDKVFSLDGSYVMVRDSAYSDAVAFKTAMSGVYLVFEKSTPTTRQLTPFPKYQKVDNWGTEEFVDERTVPIPVGHDSRYLPDLKAKLESAPSNPSTNGKYFLQYQNGEATYVPVPSEVPQTPSEDGTYVLKATVSSGTATLAWVAEE